MAVAGGAGCGDLLCEQAGEVKEEWVARGAGKGDFVKVEKVEYIPVGPGQGDYAFEQVRTTSTRIQWWVLLILFFFVLIATAVALYFLLNVSTEDGNKHSEIRDQSGQLHAELRAERLPNCYHEYWDFHRRWSTAKKAYCCKHANRGCPEPHVFVKTRVVPAPAPPPRIVERDHYVKVPDPQVKMHTKYVVLPSPTEKPEIVTKYRYKYMTPTRPDCKDGYDNWRDSWDSHKIEWCCAHHNKACYDCDEGSDKWRQVWSEHKKVWCCNEHDDRFCDYE